MNLDRLTKQVVRIVKNASKLYHNQKFFEVVERHKYERDDVTNNDILTQAYLEKKLLKLIPNSSFVGEEGSSGSEEDDGYVWIIDPIDGTQNYKKGIPLYGTQLALQYNRKTILSVIYFPVNRQMYVATPSGSTLNGQPIKVSSETDLKWSSACICNYRWYIEIEDKYKIEHKLVSTLKTVRLLGCSALNYSLCACGKMELVIVFGNTIWDLYPGKYLIEQAGGMVYSNNDLSLHIAGSIDMVEKVRKLLGV